jgi:hypothetical protein
MRSPGLSFFLLVTFLLPLVAVSLSWSGSIYQWTDENGNVGFTDDLSKIPEKYRNSAILEREIPAAPDEEKEGGEAPPDDQGLELPPEPPEVDNAGHDRSYWENRLKDLRDQQDALIEKKAKLDQEINAMSNPLIYNTAQDKQLRQKKRNEAESTEQQINEIEHQLKDVIPEEARRLNVPPGWLR